MDDEQYSVCRPLCQRRERKCLPEVADPFSDCIFIYGGIAKINDGSLPVGAQQERK